MQQDSTTINGASRALSGVERAIYFAIAGLLALIAVALLVWTLVVSGGLALAGHVGEAAHKGLQDLLLVFMLVEIIHTAGISLKGKGLRCEPFLIIGVIAAIRRMLVITAEQVTPTAENAATFYLVMIELGVLTLIILSLVAAIFVLRRAPGEEGAA